MSSENRSGALASFMVLAIAAALGCGGPGGTDTTIGAADKAAFEKKNGVDESKAAALVKGLEATPAAERRVYLQQHSEDVRNMALVQDRQLQEKFHALMEGRQ